jgi:hypothetical protein
MMSKLIQAFLPNRAEPALGEGIGIRRLNWGQQHVDPLGDEHGVKGVAELGVAVMDEKTDMRLAV